MSIKWSLQLYENLCHFNLGQRNQLYIPFFYLTILIFNPFICCHGTWFLFNFSFSQLKGFLEALANAMVNPVKSHYPLLLVYHLYFQFHFQSFNQVLVLIRAWHFSCLLCQFYYPIFLILIFLHQTNFYLFFTSSWTSFWQAIWRSRYHC